MSKVRHWTFTSYDLENYEIWKSIDLTFFQIRFLSYQLELTTTTNKKHIQGYVEFFDQIRMNSVKKRLKAHGLHLEPRKGTRTEARDYSIKDEVIIRQYPKWASHGLRVEGTLPVLLGKFRTDQGHRSDLDTMIAMIKNGARESDLIEYDPKLYMRNYRSMQRMIQLNDNKYEGQFISNMKVHVLYGDPGAGKTRTVYDKHGFENVYAPVHNGTKYWFTDYAGEKILLINEFYGQCPFHFFQDLIDKRRIRLDGKCQNPISNWDTIYITTNCHPREWWNSYQSIPSRVIPSFMRRIDSITEMLNPKLSEYSWDNIPTMDELKTQTIPECEGFTVLPPRTSDPNQPTLGEFLTNSQDSPGSAPGILPNPPDPNAWERQETQREWPIVQGEVASAKTRRRNRKKNRKRNRTSRR